MCENEATIYKNKNTFRVGIGNDMNMHVHVNSTSFFFCSTAKSVASSATSSKKKQVFEEAEGSDNDVPDLENDSDEGSEVCNMEDLMEMEEDDEDEDDDLDDAEEELPLDPEEERLRKVAVADAKKNGYLAPITGKAKGARKVVEKVGGRRRLKGKGGKGAKPSGKKKTNGVKKPKAEKSCVAASSSVPINNFYNSATDSQSGTLVRGSPDKVKKVMVAKNKSKQLLKKS